MVKYRDFSEYSRKSLPLYNKIFIDPVSKIISLPIINYTKIRPYQITLFGLFLSFISAYLFYNSEFVVGAVIFQITVVLDSVDGYVARLKNNGSIFGILLDSYTDIIRVFINILGIIMSGINIETSFLLMIFLFLNFAESWIDFALISVKEFLKKQKNIGINLIDKRILLIKDKLERIGLRTIFIYYQERVFIVLFVGPIFGDIKSWTIVGIVLVLLSMHIKMLLDVALIKSSLINKEKEELRGDSI
jgi:phosphatidylglycerophosphate synthase